MHTSSGEGTTRGQGVTTQEINDNTVDFETAITLTGHGKFHYIALVGCGCCLFSMIFVTFITGYLLPTAQCDLHLTTQDKGLLNAICFVGMISSSHLWGFLADTQGRKRILVTTLLLDFLCGIGASFSPNLTTLVVFRFFNGFFICGPAAVMYAYLGEFHSNATRTRAILWAGVFVAMGITALPGMAWLILPQTWSYELPWFTYNSWRFFIVICSLPSLLTAVIFMFLPESPKFLFTQGKEEEAMEILRRVYAINSGRLPDDYPVKGLRLDYKLTEGDVLISDLPRTGHHSKSVRAVLNKMWMQTTPLFKSPYLLCTCLACILDFGIFACSNGLILWLPEIFNRFTEYGHTHPGNELTVCGIIDALANNSHLLPFPFNETGTTVALELEDMLPTDGDMVFTAPDCKAFIDPAVFQNTVTIGGASALAYFLVGILARYWDKKFILVLCMTVSGGSIVGINYVSTASSVLTLACLFMALSSCCISVVNSVVVDSFPTHLRAMAVCLSMMVGRVGTIVGSVLVGLLLEINCTSVFFVLGGTVLCCGLLAILLPAKKKV